LGTAGEDGTLRLTREGSAYAGLLHRLRRGGALELGLEIRQAPA
jgi:hypothetical protein